MRRRKSIIKVLLIAIYILINQNCYSNVSTPILSQPIATSTQVITLVYDPNEIFRFKFCTRYQTIIQTSSKEQIKYISFGDPTPWSMKMVGNTIYITPRNPTSPTNMTIVTDQRTYLFEISATVADELINQSCIYLIRFFYPEVNPDAPTVTTKQIPLDKQLKTPTQSEIKREVANADGKLLNFNYSLSGKSESVTPLEVFDDGKRTYLKFPKDNASVPTIYIVNAVGLEEPASYTRENQYVVVDTVAKQLALRSNAELTCVFNDFLIEQQIKKK